MNKTQYEFIISELQVNEWNEIIKVLPPTMSFKYEEGNHFLEFETSKVMDDDQVRFLIERECNRIFFLTNERLEPNLKIKVLPDGSKHRYESIQAPFRNYKKIEPEISQQEWDKKIATQLKLWYLSKYKETFDDIIRLWFKIIEASYPDTQDETQYPPYFDTNDPPHPRTEAKLLRNYVSHQQPNISSKQLRNYCLFLKIPTNFFTPIDFETPKIMGIRMEIIRKETRKTINRSISIKTD